MGRFWSVPQVLAPPSTVTAGAAFFHEIDLVPSARGDASARDSTRNACRLVIGSEARYKYERKVITEKKQNNKCHVLIG